jgi:putative spermidine/putrescine transport system permease protein
LSAAAGNVLGRLWKIAVWAFVIFFVVNVLATIAAVVINSFGTRWLNSWVPPGYTFRWYAAAWREFQLGDVLLVTFEIAVSVVVLSALVGEPASND